MAHALHQLKSFDVNSFPKPCAGEILDSILDFDLITDLNAPMHLYDYKLSQNPLSDALHFLAVPV